MSDHASIAHTIAFVERHGYALLFWWVLAEQGAVPLPSVPLLVAAGALVRAGKLHPVLALGSCVAGALIADTGWFVLGRRRGPRVLRWICRISLEPDSCVRRTENVFLKYGMNSLLVSKFVPGLNAVAAPLAGSSAAGYLKFLPFDVAGAALWSGTYLALGYIFAQQVETVVGYASRMGSWLLLFVGALFGGWVVWKFFQRKRFLYKLNVARITPQELRDMLDAGEAPFIVDVRGGKNDDPSPVPGAVRIAVEELTARRTEIPRDRDIILFCT